MQIQIILDLDITKTGHVCILANTSIALSFYAEELYWDIKQ